MATPVDESFTVTPAPLTVNATNESMTYGGTVPTLTYTYTGLVNNDTSATFSGSLVTAATSSSNVGDYPITQGTLAATGNYTISTYNPGTLTVIAAPLTVTATNESMTYGGTVPVLGYTYTGLVNKDTSATFTGSLVTTATSSSNVGGYPIIQGTLAATGNYTISTYNPGTLTVIAAPLTVTATNESMTYGGTVPTLTYAYTGLVNSDTSATFSGGLATTATSSSSVGGYSITVGSLAATGNYAIDTFNPGTLTVNAAALTITANNDSKTYGTLKTFSGTAFTETGLGNGDTITGVTETSTGAPASVTVGTYNIVPSAATGAGLRNYTITYISGTLTVNTATLTITANNATKVYGAPLPLLGVGYSGFVNGDKAANLTTPPTLATTAIASSHVQAGGYQVAASGASDPNYAITYQPGTLLITPAPLTVTASSTTKVYGAGLPPLTYTIGGFVNGDTASAVSGVPAITTTATASSHVSNSPYPITVTTGSLSASDYGFNFVNGSLTVTPAPLTIMANNAMKVYGAALPALSASYSGLINGDTAATLATPPTLATTAAASSHVLPDGYAIIASGASDPDYTISYQTGTLLVTPAPLIITANSGL